MPGDIIQRFFGASLLAVLILASCSSSGPVAIDPAITPPGILEVRPTLSFGDAPLVGELRIRAADGSGNWRYAVDLDEDGTPDETGPLDLGVALSYRFTTIGVHEITIELENAGRRYRLERRLVVNDPAATTVDELLDLGTPGIPALDESEARLFVADGATDRLYVLRASDLARIDSLQMATLRFGPGVALSGDTLFVATGDSVVAVDVAGSPRNLGRAADGHWGKFLKLRSDGLLYVGGEQGVALLDPRTGQVRSERSLERFFSQSQGVYALAPDEETVAQIQGLEVPTILLLGADDLQERHRITIDRPSAVAISVAFTPDSDRLYVMVGGTDWRLYAYEVASGRLLGESTISLGSGGGGGAEGPAAIAGDSRFVVFATAVGAFFIDPNTDLPAFRTARDPETNNPGCCSVISARSGRLFYLVDSFGPLQGTVYTLRLHR